MIFHENFNFQKIITPELEEIWRSYFPETLHYITSSYQESFSSKEKFSMKIDPKNLKKRTILDRFGNF